MKVLNTFSICIAMSGALIVSNVQALGLGDLAGAAGALQGGQAAAPAGASSGLTGMLMQQLGVSQTQATGGAGAIFQMAKAKMQGDAFAKLSSSVPGMSGMLAAAPATSSTSAGGLGALAGSAAGLGGAGSSAGNLMGLAGSFQQLGLSPDMVQKFVPVVMQYVQGTGGGGVSSMLQSALMGGM